MKKVANFQKVSLEQYRKDLGVGNDDTFAKEILDNIKKPKRATRFSACYDFFAPHDIMLTPGASTKIYTGIRCTIDKEWGLFIAPRSGLGFKYKLRLDNTIGIIDADYYMSDNEGHIIIKMTNCGDKMLSIKAGQGFAQGVFLQYGITIDDEEDEKEVRNGGFGSTDKKDKSEKPSYDKKKKKPYKKDSKKETTKESND